MLYGVFYDYIAEETSLCFTLGLDTIFDNPETAKAYIDKHKEEAPHWYVYELEIGKPFSRGKAVYHT